MNETDILHKRPRTYWVHLLNPDIQKKNMDVFAARNIKISPSGLLECTQIYSYKKGETNTFYLGEFFITEMNETEIKSFMSHGHKPEK